MTELLCMIGAVLVVSSAYSLPDVAVVDLSERKALMPDLADLQGHGENREVAVL